MSTPEQHAPPVYACAAGAVSHAHAGGTLEPAVLLHTFVPSEVRAALDEGGTPRVDVSADGPGAGTLTLRVLVGAHALSWQLPAAPLVAALPGQLGDDGRMVLLALVDGQPEPGFWARPVDCEQLAAELALPVADLAEALSGRLISWLSADLDELLHLDAHDRASALSPAQSLADAVLAHYRGDLSASQEAARVVEAVRLLEPAEAIELGARLSAALATAVVRAEPAARQAVRDALGPFETEALRLLDELPGRLAEVPPREYADLTMQLLVSAPERDEAVRAALSLTASLARAAAGPGLDGPGLLAHLGMVDDEGLARLARLWVTLAVLAQGPAEDDEAAGTALLPILREQGAPAAQWLRSTAATLADLATEVAGRQRDRLAAPLAAVDALLDADPRGADAEAAVLPGVQACLVLARFVRRRAGLGPGSWLVGRPAAAAQAVGEAAALDAPGLGGPDPELLADLMVELLEEDVEGPDLLDALLCASSMLLVDVDPQADPVLREAQVHELLQSVPPGARGGRWLLDLLLREAPDHDPSSADLRPYLPPVAPEDPDRVAERAGRAGVVREGFRCLGALAQSLGEEAHRTPAEVLGVLLATGLENHDLLRVRD